MKLVRGRGKSVALAVLAGSLAYSLAGCGSNSGPATDGPLAASIKVGGECATGRVGHPQAFGDLAFTNHGHNTLVLDRVALMRPHNEHLIGSFAVPGIYVIGLVPWPPRPSPVPSTWKDRQPVHGFRLAPGKTFNMVLGVVATARGRATSQGMMIYYHDTAGSSYLANAHFASLIYVTNRGCSSR